tara:strand:+ start:202 stop:1281 length:1080 start_codon:yes stop_codon:yes gene_type:complete
MAQPFSLDRAIATPSSAAQRMQRQRMFDKQADEATSILNQKIRDMQKKAKKGAGLFKGLGKSAPWVKAALSTALKAAGWGHVDLAIKAADAYKTQKDLKKHEKAIKSMGGMPAKFAGTFLEDYLKGGITDAKGQMSDFMKGKKDTAKMMAAISMVPAALEGMEGLGATAETATKAGEAAATAGDVAATAGDVAAAGTETAATAGAQAAEKTLMDKAQDVAMDHLKGQEMKYYPQDMGSDKFLNRLFAKVEKGIMDYGTDAAGTMTDTAAQTATQAAGDAAGQAATDAASRSWTQKLSNFAGKQLDKGVPGTLGLLDMRDLTTPLGAGASSLASDLYMNYLNQQQGEPAMSRARAPQYYR